MAFFFDGDNQSGLVFQSAVRGKSIGAGGALDLQTSVTPYARLFGYPRACPKSIGFRTQLISDK
jgi:hypothetical protein